MKTDTDIDELEASRALDTDPRGLAPPPEFVGTPPESIPGAPDWANTLISEVREVHEETRGVREDLQAILTNQTLFERQFGLFRLEARSKMSSHDGELEQLRADVDSVRRRLARIERRHG